MMKISTSDIEAISKIVEMDVIDLNKIFNCETWNDDVKLSYRRYINDTKLYETSLKKFMDTTLTIVADLNSIPSSDKQKTKIQKLAQELSEIGR